MSTLWKARVVARRPDGAVLALHAVHPDAGELTGSRVFAFRVLMDAPRQWAPPRLTADEEPAMASVIIESADVDELRNVPFDEAAAHAAVQRELLARGLSPQDEDGWAAAFGERWRALWADPERVPSGRLTVRVSDPKWVAGLEPGTEWETSAY